MIADPGTVAAGRVVDLSGAGVAEASVECVGVSGASGADGSFAIGGVPTLPALISCGASATGPGGAPLVGRTAAVAPVPGGATPVGEAILGSQVIFLGSGDGFGQGPEGRLYILDPAGSEAVPWSPPFSPSGLSALAFDDEGSLFATGLDGTLDGPVVSPLYRLDPATGEILENRGLVSDPESGELAVHDLAFDTVSGRLFALSGNGGIYTVDPETADADFLVSTGGSGSAARLDRRRLLPLVGALVLVRRATREVRVGGRRKRSGLTPGRSSSGKGPSQRARLSAEPLGSIGHPFAVVNPRRSLVKTSPPPLCRASRRRDI